MIDLPVAVIIGAAFGKVVDSLVKHILMPLVGLVLPGEWGYLRWEVVAGAKEVPYGLFLAEVVTFLVVALALFLFVAELRGWATKARKGEAAAPPLLTRDQEPPTEIRDLLKRGPAS